MEWLAHLGQSDELVADEVRALGVADGVVEDPVLGVDVEGSLIRRQYMLLEWVTKPLTAVGLQEYIYNRRQHVSITSRPSRRTKLTDLMQSFDDILLVSLRLPLLETLGLLCSQAGRVHGGGHCCEEYFIWSGVGEEKALRWTGKTSANHALCICATTRFEGFECLCDPCLERCYEQTQTSFACSLISTVVSEVSLEWWRHFFGENEWSANGRFFRWWEGRKAPEFIRVEVDVHCWRDAPCSCATCSSGS